MKWEYLHDGVYIADDGFHLILATGSHDNPDNTVYLDGSCLEGLLKFLERSRGLKITVEKAE